MTSEATSGRSVKFSSDPRRMPLAVAHLLADRPVLGEVGGSSHMSQPVPTMGVEPVSDVARHDALSDPARMCRLRRH